MSWHNDVGIKLVTFSLKIIQLIPRVLLSPRVINYHQASDKIGFQFYTEQLLKPENSLRTTGIEPVPSDCEQQA